MTRRGVLRAFGAAALALLIAGAAAPFLSAGRFKDKVRRSMERSLGRTVEINGDMRFSLFTGPGFTLEKVVIHEDPSVSLEPVAYVESLTVRPKIASLWRMRFEIASILLDDASVNLMRTEAGFWNFEPYLNRTVFSTLPELRVRNGRVNFKLGDLQSVFYLTNSRIDVTPPASGQTEWRAAFTGEPARTDRPGPWPAHGFGAISAKGRWSYLASGEPALDIDLSLDPSHLSEISTLLYGYDLGIHGTVSARARAAGAISSIHIAGRLNVEELHRWDQAPARGSVWTLPYQGMWSIPAQWIDLASQPPAGGAIPLTVHFRASDYLSRPHWGVSANWNRFPVEPLVDVARRMGIAAPANVKLTGTLDGAVTYSEQGRWQGELAFHEAALAIPESPSVQFEEARIFFDGDRVHLAPSLVRTGEDETAKIEADYAARDENLRLSISTDAMRIASLHAQASLAAVPLLEHLESGGWKGTLRYESQSGWTGRIELSDADLSLPELANAVHIESAVASVEAGRLALDRVRARVEEVKFNAEYRYDNREKRPHRLKISAPELSCNELEGLLGPLLARRRGLLARALNRSVLPPWLAERRAEAALQIGSLQVSDSTLKQFQGRLIWDGARIEISSFQARSGNGAVSGRIAADLRRNTPAYRIVLRWNDLPWKGGEIDGDGALETSGLGSALLKNLRAQGSFAARGTVLFPDFEAISGGFRYEGSRLRLSELQMSDGEETYTGSGATQSDGRLLIQLTNGHRRLRAAGTVAQWAEQSPRWVETPAP